MFSLGILTCAIVEDGWVTFALGGIVTLLALVLFILDDPRAFRIVLMWCVGFLSILAGEGLSDASVIIRLYGADAYDTASRCIVASHFAVLLGRELVFDERRVVPATSPWRLSTRIATPVLILGWLITLVYLMPTALVAYQGGRAAFESRQLSTITAIAEGLSLTTRIVVPIAAVWIAKQSTGSTRLLMLLMAASVFLLGLVSGVRFVLLFSAVGSAIAWMVPRPPSRRTFAVLFAVALTLAIASRVLSETRTFGIGESDVGSVIDASSPTEFVVMSEKSVQSMTQAVIYARHRGHTDGRTSAAVLVFWVPRALWPDKPTLIGFWLPREFGRVESGFSAAPAFTGSSYVDFGLWGSVVLWFIGGLFFGVLERATARVCAAEGDARVLFVAPLYGGAFFAVRSPDTAALTLVGVFVSTMFLMIIAGRRPTAKRAAA
jgi:hypothetical protein